MRTSEGTSKCKTHATSGDGHYDDVDGNAGADDVARKCVSEKLDGVERGDSPT
jgi:hypothetical protein